MHRLSSSFVLGYHGCDKAVAEAVLNNTPFVESKNDYDWLGPGIYFWESNPLRGLEFAQEIKEKRGTIKNPSVVGAPIELGFCLDLISSTGIAAVKEAYRDFKAHCKASGTALPENKVGSDLLFRRLDFAVINHLHDIRRRGGLQQYDTVKGVFIEGSRIYTKAGFRRKTHIQICVRNAQCIKGVFRVPEDQLK